MCSSSTLSYLVSLNWKIIYLSVFSYLCSKFSVRSGNCSKYGRKSLNSSENQKLWPLLYFYVSMVPSFLFIKRLFRAVYEWKCAQSLLKNKRVGSASVTGCHLLFRTSFLLSPFVSFGLSFLQMVSTGHSISFVLHPLLELPIQFRVQPHLRESFYIPHLLKTLQKCSSLSVSCGLCWPLKTEAKLWGWTLWGSPYLCFQTQNLNYNFPRSHL